MSPIIAGLRILCFASLGIAALAATTHAAPIAYSSGSYSQNFDSLANTGTGIAWTNDGTIAGWHSTRATYDAGSGTNNAGGLYSFGSASAADRALGSIASNTVVSVRYGAQLVNTSGFTIDNFSLSFTGEQWRNGGNTTAHTLAFDYSLDPAATLTAGTYTNVSDLAFTSPIATAAASALDGNLAANRAFLGATVTGISWAPGASLWIRWTDLNDAGNDHALAIDDVKFSANVPEPTTLTIGVLIGAFVGGLAWRRRR